MCEVEKWMAFNMRMDEEQHKGDDVAIRPSVLDMHKIWGELQECFPRDDALDAAVDAPIVRGWHVKAGAVAGTTFMRRTASSGHMTPLTHVFSAAQSLSAGHQSQLNFDSDSRYP